MHRRAFLTPTSALIVTLPLGGVFAIREPAFIERVDYRGLEPSLLTPVLTLAAGTAAMVLPRSGTAPLPGVTGVCRVLVAAPTLLAALQRVYQPRASVAGTLGWADP